MKRTILALSAVALLAGATTAACSSGSSSESAPTASGSMVGGPSVCDNETISAAITGQLEAEGEGLSLFALDGLTCADGWAVAMPTIGAEEANAVTTTAILQAEGQFWLPKDHAAACGTQDDNDLAAYPADAQIPESLYAEGCTTN